MIKPFGTRILVKMDEAIETTMGNIIITSNSQEKPNSACIVTLGASYTAETYGLSEGTVVLLPKDAGIEVEDNDSKFVLIELTDIIATVEQ
jgi:chaperonin GroES